MSCGAFVSLSDNSRGTLPSSVASPKCNDNKIQLASLNGRSRGCTAPYRSGRLLQVSGSPRGEIGRCEVLKHRGPVLLPAVSRLRSRPPRAARGRGQRVRLRKGPAQPPPLTEGWRAAGSAGVGSSAFTAGFNSVFYCLSNQNYGCYRLLPRHVCCRVMPAHHLIVISCR